MPEVINIHIMRIDDGHWIVTTDKTVAFETFAGVLEYLRRYQDENGF